MKTAKKYFSLLLFLPLFAASCNDTASTTPNPTNSVGATGVNETKILQLVNDLRRQGCNCGATAMPPVATVTWNNLLANAAFDHSKDMEQKSYFSHTSQDGRNPGQRITAKGYQWSTYGENIAKGYANEEAVVQGWQRSEGHCRNIMNGNFTEMGVGKSGDYWTQVFGKR